MTTIHNTSSNSAKNLILVLVLFFITFQLNGQNIGINTTDPTANLHIQAFEDTIIYQNFESQESSPMLKEGLWLYNSEVPDGSAFSTNSHGQIGTGFRRLSYTAVVPAGKTATLSYDIKRNVYADGVLTLPFEAPVSSTGNLPWTNIVNTFQEGSHLLEWKIENISPPNLAGIIYIDNILLVYVDNNVLRIESIDVEEGKVLTSDAVGNATWEYSSNLSDTDKDTKIDVESSPDNDAIKFFTKGHQSMIISNNGKTSIFGKVNNSSDPLFESIVSQSSIDIAAVKGHSAVTPFYGIGGDFVGGWIGLRGEAKLQGTGTRIGVLGKAEGGASNNWAGYFSIGDTYVGGDLRIGTTELHNSLPKVRIRQTNSSAAGLLIENNSANAHTWIPYSDGSIYLTGDKTKTEGNVILRTWDGTNYVNVLTAHEDGGASIYNGTLNVEERQEIGPATILWSYPVLSVKQSSTNQYGFELDNTSNNGSWAMSHNTDNNPDDLQFIYRDGNTSIYAATLDSDGNWTLISDRKHKKNVIPLDGQLEKIMRLSPKNYIFKHDTQNKLQYGLIAQELQPEFPALVKQMKDDQLGINYTGLIPVVIKAMQEQQVIINQLQDTNQMLIRRLEKLEATIK